MKVRKPFAFAVAGAFALTACGGSDEPAAPGAESEMSSELSGNLVGAGASSQQAAMQGWIAGYSEIAPDVTVNYDPIGSGGGREQFLAGGTAFAGSDAYLDDEELAMAMERCGPSGAINLPDYIAPIALPFNLEGVDSLNLSAEVIAQIFNQQITMWNDPAIAADNPETMLPAVPIVPVNRSDESGTTENFVDYLSQAAGEENWPYEVSGDWPVPGGEQGQQTSGVIQAVGAGNGTIGYADASQVGDLPTVAVGVGEEFVEYSPEAAAAVVENGEAVAGRGEFDRAIDIPRDTAESGNYPIVLISYHVACLEYDNQSDADLVKGFLGYVVSEEGQQASADAAGSAPISDSLRQQVMASLEQITVAG